MNSFSSIINSLSGYAVAITAIIGAIALIFKPIRKRFADKFERKKNEDILAIKESVTQLGATITEMKREMNTRFDEQKAQIDINERDRLKEVIFRYGNIARHGARISSEEFRNLQTVYEKYSQLGGNSIAHDEYDYVVNYYNGQDFAHDFEGMI